MSCTKHTGEIACGYGDGCFSREQTVLVAYHRGRMCPEHGVSGGLMAAVGLRRRRGGGAPGQARQGQLRGRLRQQPRQHHPLRCVRRGACALRPLLALGLGQSQ